MTLWSLLFGPLFPWSPVKPGYNRFVAQRGDIYYSADSSASPDYARFDEDVLEMERFHQLPLPRRVTVIACRTWSDFHRFLPTVRGTGLGAATPEYGTVIFITPRVREIDRTDREFIRHELSHAILLQHATIMKGLQFKKSPWLFEGLAVLAADQQTYGTWDDFARIAETEDLRPMFRGRVPASGRAYLTWRYFLQWLIDTQGRARFQRLLASFVREPELVEGSFEEVYGETLLGAAERFQQGVRVGKWEPPGKNGASR